MLAVEPAALAIYHEPLEGRTLVATLGAADAVVDVFLDLALFKAARSETWSSPQHHCLGPKALAPLRPPRSWRSTVHYSTFGTEHSRLRAKSVPKDTKKAKGHHSAEHTEKHQNERQVAAVADQIGTQHVVDAAHDKEPPTNGDVRLWLQSSHRRWRHSVQLVAKRGNEQFPGRQFLRPGASYSRLVCAIVGGVFPT
jgi:hypothetical protein